MAAPTADAATAAAAPQPAGGRIQLKERYAAATLRARRGLDRIRTNAGTCLRPPAATSHSFTSELKLESFYTGGKLALTADGQVLVTPCGDDIKVLDLATGVVKYTLPGVCRDWYRTARCSNLPAC